MKILITAPLKQKPEIFREFQEGLDNLYIPNGVEVDRFFVVNDDPDIIKEIHDADYVEVNTGDEYVRTTYGHIWSKDNFDKMSLLRNVTIERMLDGGYDFWFSIDTDVVVHPDTLIWLLKAKKDIVTEIFWTNSGRGWWCNAWMYDQHDADGQLEKWKQPGLYKVGMSGACTLAKRKVFEAGVNYSLIPNIRNAIFGEDRPFCVRVACAGFDMWLDTHCPATHLYSDKEYKGYMKYKSSVLDKEANK